jgi:signal peptidase I
VLSGTDSTPPRSRFADRKPSSLAAFAGFALEVLKVVVFALAIIVPVRYFLVQPFYVKGASMEPTFQDREYLLIDEISYRFRTPSRGEVVVLRNPTRESEFFIKRVVGLPGEHLEVNDGRIEVKNADRPGGFVLDESAYLNPAVETAGTVRVDLGPKQYFVFGDNRNYSLDSRAFGAVDRREIVGRVWIRALPVSRFDAFSAPAYAPSP